MLLNRRDSDLAKQLRWIYKDVCIKLKWNSKRRVSCSRVLHLMSDKMVLHFKITIKTRALKCKIDFWHHFQCWPKAFHACSIFKIKKQCVWCILAQIRWTKCFVSLMTEIMGYVSGSCYYLQVNKCNLLPLQINLNNSQNKELSIIKCTENCTELSCLSYLDTFLNSLSPV